MTGELQAPIQGLAGGCDEQGLHVFWISSCISVESEDGTGHEGPDDAGLRVLDESGDREEREAQAGRHGVEVVRAVGPVVDGPQVGSGYSADVSGVEDLRVARYLGSSRSGENILGAQSEMRLTNFAALSGGSWAAAVSSPRAAGRSGRQALVAAGREAFLLWGEGQP